MTEYARAGIDVSTDFAAAGVFALQVPDGTHITYQDAQRPEDPRHEWLQGAIIASPRLYGRVLCEDGSAIGNFGWVAWPRR